MVKIASYDLTDKICVISGGTSGIGLAAARLMAGDGAQVYLVGRDTRRGEAAVQELGGKASFIGADLSTVEGCAKAAAALRDIRIDVLVNSAGIYAEERLERVTPASYTEIMDINVKGTLFLIQALMPLFNEGAAVVNIASDAGLHGNYGCPVYCASKGAVVALTRALALDLAPRIRVNCICPGDVATPLLDRQMEAGGSSAEEIAACYPLGRIAEAEEVAHVICSVASPRNSFMTGSIISVDGGITA